MVIFLTILISAVAGILFFCFGRLIGNFVGKKQKMQDEVLRNGNMHV